MADLAASAVRSACVQQGQQAWMHASVNGGGSGSKRG